MQDMMMANFFQTGCQPKFTMNERPIRVRGHLKAVLTLVGMYLALIQLMTLRPLAVAALQPEL